MKPPAFACKQDLRREAVRRAQGRYGLDYLEVSEDQLALHVTFLGKAPGSLQAGNFLIEGGERIRGIRVTFVSPPLNEPNSGTDDSADITLNVVGDFSTYTLRVVAADKEGRPTSRPLPNFDPLFDRVEFRFKASCPSDLDCKTQALCPPETRQEPDINYLSKDYASFRQLILDRLALLVPDWQERHVPDIGIALVEILAYVGDHLSYHQDAVATEAYLETARQRISVRRHVRLVDYPMHEGCNARTWLCVCTGTTDRDLPRIDPGDIYFITRFENAPQDRWVLLESDIENVPESSYTVFEPLVSDVKQLLAFYAGNSKIRFYTWGNRDCCLPRGATSAALCSVPARNAAVLAADQKQRELHLLVGDVLLFEEVIGPLTGVPNDADPTHRHAVRLTRVEPAVDDLYTLPDGQPQPIVLVEWAEEDALPFALCISSTTQAPECKDLDDVSIACGNVILVDHGRTIEPPESPGSVPTKTSHSVCECECHPAETTLVPGLFRPYLKRGPLTFSQPLAVHAPASQMLLQDPRRALPQISLSGTEAAPGGPVVTDWHARRDLLESGSTDSDFVVEMDDAGIAHLRFGDGDCGKLPEAETSFSATYRVGNGREGNVGAQTIRYLVFRKNPVFDGIRICNPLPARGGTLPEAVSEVKLLAPHVFRTRLERAITADDYAVIAERNPKLQRAAAALRWTGSWYEALASVDPVGSEVPDKPLLRAVERYLYRFRRIGHDLAVVPAQYISLDIKMVVCVLPDYLRAHVEAELLDRFSNRVLPDGRLGFFHPDNLTFGEGVSLSRLIAAAQSCAGVESVKVEHLERLYEGPNGELENGVLPLGPYEIARVDSDPSFPEHGQIVFDLRGGR